MAEQEVAIHVSRLVKRYGPKTAVDGLSFDVHYGEIFAFLGPNGAGKSTTVEILEGYRARDDGTVRVLGLDPIQDAARLKARMGVMLQGGGLYLTMTPREALHLFARFYPQPNDPDETLALVGLEDAAGTRFRRLSGGQKQRLSLALALVGRPDLVFLDEATAGMDPQARHLTWKLIRDLRDTGVTILFTTHYLEEVEHLADRVAIIDHGRLLAIGTPAQLSGMETGQVQLRLGSSIDLGMLASLPSASGTSSNGEGRYSFETQNVAQLFVEITVCLRDAGVPILELRAGSGSLEQLFLRLTADGATG